MATVRDFDEFLANPMAGDAVIRNIEIIGEASRKIQLVAPEFIKQNLALAKTLAVAYNMRNAVIYGYIEVDYRIVYDTAKYSLSAFKEQIESFGK